MSIILHKESIIDHASALGFALCGFAKCEPLAEIRPFYDEFLREKNFGGMDYLVRYAPQRLDPSLLLPGAKTVVCVVLGYYPPVLVPSEDNFVTSKYAYGPDYHRVMKEKLEQLAAHVQSAGTGIKTRVFVDSGPVLEKAWAQRCGIGWQGKNTLVINQLRGSFFFIGILLTTLAIEPDQPAEDHCGECTRCMKACPTGALDRPYRLDIPRCISFHTIENKTAVTETEPVDRHDRIYGCDICQDACPFNRHAPDYANPAFRPPDELLQLRKKDWIGLTEQQFDRIFGGTPAARLGYARLMENIRAV